MAEGKIDRYSVVVAACRLKCFAQAAALVTDRVLYAV